MSLFAPPPVGARQDAVLERFRKAAEDPRGLFDYPTGAEGLAGLGYAPGLLARLPAEVLKCFCGVGNPFLPGLPEAGWRVLDVGCGSGVDALVAALLVGASGRVEGLELSEHMLERARKNAAAAGLDTLAFAQGGAESLPYPDAGFDLIISNGVYNLVPDKARALAEAFRVLKPGGRLQLADQIRETDEPLSCPLAGPGADWAR